MPSNRAAVAPGVDRILAAIQDVGLAPPQREDLAVALAEALSNAAIHGNHLKPGSEVKVALKITPGVEVTVGIEDSGLGFDRTALHDPTDPTRILVPGGRGVFLMRRLVDHLEYNAAGNRVRLTIRKRRRARSG
jgi:anti-sigma regulatory factor (Ser/Thr protein kinase)